MPQEGFARGYAYSQSHSFDGREQVFERNFQSRLCHLNFITFKEIS